jgi:uridine kinase
MDSPSELVALLGTRPPTLGAGRLLCLDGPAGSGKTTLAARIAALGPFAGQPATVLHLDDLYDGWSGLPRLGEQLDTLLLPLDRGETGSYRRYDWAAGRFAETVAVPPSPLLIVEGVGSGLAAYARLRTLLVWVDVPAEVRLSRWRARDGAAAEPFIAGWQRAEEALFAREGTRAAADVRWPSVEDPRRDDTR